MALLKRILPKRLRDQLVPDHSDDAIPRLVRKKKSKKAALPKPQTAVFEITLETFSNPALPNIVLRPPTPPVHIFDVQERLFERSGAVFVLRKDDMSAQCQRPGSLTAHQLREPAKPETVQVHGGLPKIVESDAESEESDDSGVGLDEDYEADYRAYMAGMNGDI